MHTGCTAQNEKFGPECPRGRCLEKGDGCIDMQPRVIACSATGGKQPTGEMKDGPGTRARTLSRRRIEQISDYALDPKRRKRIGNVGTSNDNPDSMSARNERRHERPPNEPRTSGHQDGPFPVHGAKG